MKISCLRSPFLLLLFGLQLPSANAALCTIENGYRLYSSPSETRAVKNVGSKNLQVECVGLPQSGRQKVLLQNQTYFIDTSGVLNNTGFTFLSEEKYEVKEGFVLWIDSTGKDKKTSFFSSGMDREYVRLFLDENKQAILENDRIKVMANQKNRRGNFVEMVGWVTLEGIERFEMDKSNSNTSSNLIDVNEEIRSMYEKALEAFHKYYTSNSVGYTGGQAKINIANEDSDIHKTAFGQEVLEQVSKYQRLGATTDKKCLAQSFCMSSFQFSVDNILDDNQQGKSQTAWIDSQRILSISAKTVTAKNTLALEISNLHGVLALNKGHEVIDLDNQVCFSSLNTCFSQILIPEYKNTRDTVAWIRTEDLVDPVDLFLSGQSSNSQDQEEEVVEAPAAPTQGEEAVVCLSPDSKNVKTLNFELSQELFKVPNGDSVTLFEKDPNYPAQELSQGEDTFKYVLIESSQGLSWIPRRHLVPDAASCQQKFAEIQSAQSISEKKVVCTESGDNLIVRDANLDAISSGNQILSLKNGLDILQISSEENKTERFTYVKVKHEKGEGWVAKEFLVNDKSECSSLNRRYVCTKEGDSLTVRNKDMSTQKKIANLSKVEILSSEKISHKGYEFVKVKFEGGEGYLAESFLSESLDSCESKDLSDSAGAPAGNFVSCIRNEMLKVPGYAECNSSGKCWGSKSKYKSRFYCARYVKVGILRCGGSKGYIACAEAKNCGPGLTSNGFKTLGYKDPRKAPLGSIIVYNGRSGCGHPAGHIEVKVSESQWVSDYIGSRPRSEATKCRPVKAIYYKP